LKRELGRPKDQAAVLELEALLKLGPDGDESR
jgi:hypothetical protein